MSSRAFWSVLVLLVAGCGSTSALPPSDGGRNDAGPNGDAGATITFRMVIPDGRSFCEQTQGCTGPARITIATAAGQPVSTSIPWCSTICSTACEPSPCPGVACISQGIAVKTTEYPWDGTTYGVSTCGNKVTCFQPAKARAGHYVAHMCATPGTLTAADAGTPACTSTGPAECVDVPFDLPGPSVVEGTLP